MPLEQYAGLRPVPGLVFEAYMSRPDIGSGIRMFVVSQVGRKWVHLFYGPSLHAFRLRHSEWALLFMQPLNSFASASYKRRLRAKAEQYERYGTQYNKAIFERVMGLTFTCGHDAFNKAHITKAPSKPQQSVKRR